jgi:hypothetical protein
VRGGCPFERGHDALGPALADTASTGIVDQRPGARQEIVVEQLQTALKSRVVIEQPKRCLTRTCPMRWNRGPRLAAREVAGGRRNRSWSDAGFPPTATDGPRWRRVPALGAPRPRVAEGASVIALMVVGFRQRRAPCARATGAPGLVPFAASRHPAQHGLCRSVGGRGEYARVRRHRSPGAHSTRPALYGDMSTRTAQPEPRRVPACTSRRPSMAR